MITYIDKHELVESVVKGQRRNFAFQDCLKARLHIDTSSSFVKMSGLKQETDVVSFART
jgi:hypothetical protein